ncbi:hypothetical protein C0581_02490 [Candidatus Parcubacteria bacterium]|nr:MAG: hypothetical protein C0581_02490 [Candidatus Parcubacteria bacterium]
MEFSKEILQKVSEIGSKEVSQSFTKLSGEPVEVKASAAELVSYDFISEGLQPTVSGSIITYAQLIEGAEGVSLLTIPREETLALVDLLNKQEVGTTGVLMDFDRSAVKETLNILSNSYLNALSKMTNTKIIIGAPYMMTSSHIDGLVNQLKDKQKKEDHAVVFKTSLEITKHKIKAQLYLIFNEDVVQLVKEHI